MDMAERCVYALWDMCDDPEAKALNNACAGIQEQLDLGEDIASNPDKSPLYKRVFVHAVAMRLEGF